MKKKKNMRGHINKQAVVQIEAAWTASRAFLQADFSNFVSLRNGDKLSPGVLLFLLLCVDSFADSGNTH